MNRYLVIDFEKLEILSLNKIDVNFNENDDFTSSIACENKMELLEMLKNEIYYIENKKEV